MIVNVIVIVVQFSEHQLQLEQMIIALYILAFIMLCTFFNTNIYKHYIYILRVISMSLSHVSLYGRRLVRMRITIVCLSLGVSLQVYKYLCPRNGR